MYSNDIYYNGDFEKSLKSYVSKLDILDLRAERLRSVGTGKGFIINVPTNFKPKQVISEEYDTIYSSKFGSTLKDQNIFGNAYRCACGMSIGKIKDGTLCGICHTKVEYIGEDLEYFGWIVLKKDKYIHPQMYVLLESLIGSKELDDIIEPPSDGIDKDGNLDVSKSKKKSTSPFLGIGIKEFERNFDNILNYYLRKKKAKIDVYDFIMTNKDIVFTDSYPIYTTQLRPIRISDGNCEYNEISAYFADLSKIQSNIDSPIYASDEYSILKLLYKFQITVNKVYSEIRKNYLPDKYGSIRKSIGGRFNLTSRNTIIPNDKLGVDQCIMSYYSAVKVLEQYIINILFKFKYSNLNDARIRWEKACARLDPLVEGIIKDLIKNHKSGKGFPVLINRNPTIMFGGIMQMYLVDICSSHALEIPLTICSTMSADFDGDQYNVIWSMMDDMTDIAEDLINPRNNMFISKNDGRFNREMELTTDTIVNMNSLHNMYFNYTNEELAQIEAIKSKWK